jgi:hypothetical protein
LSSKAKNHIPKQGHAKKIKNDRIKKKNIKKKRKKKKEKKKREKKSGLFCASVIVSLQFNWILGHRPFFVSKAH